MQAESWITVYKRLPSENHVCVFSLGADTGTEASYHMLVVLSCTSVECTQINIFSWPKFEAIVYILFEQTWLVCGGET